MSEKPICRKCNEPLEIDEEWRIIDEIFIGKKATRPIEDTYVHKECKYD